MARHGESKHYKRSVVPGALVVPRKKYKYYIRPLPGKHLAKWSVALLGFLRDVLKIANNAKEARYLIRSGYVSVDGKVTREEKCSIGFGDIVTVMSSSFVSSLDAKGKITGIENTLGNVKNLKLVSKSKSKGGKTVLRFNDGRNMLEDEKHKLDIGDSVKLDLSTNKITKQMPFEQGGKVMIYMGKNAGKTGKVTAIDGNSVKLESDGHEINVSKDVCFVE